MQGWEHGDELNCYFLSPFISFWHWCFSLWCCLKPLWRGANDSSKKDKPCVGYVLAAALFLKFASRNEFRIKTLFMTFQWSIIKCPWPFTRYNPNRSIKYTSLQTFIVVWKQIVTFINLKQLVMFICLMHLILGKLTGTKETQGRVQARHMAETQTSRAKTQNDLTQDKGNTEVK